MWWREDGDEEQTGDGEEAPEEAADEEEEEEEDSAMAAAEDDAAAVPEREADDGESWLGATPSAATEDGVPAGDIMAGEGAKVLLLGLLTEPAWFGKMTACPFPSGEISALDFGISTQLPSPCSTLMLMLPAEVESLESSSTTISSSVEFFDSVDRRRVGDMGRPEAAEEASVLTPVSSTSRSII